MKSPAKPGVLKNIGYIVSGYRVVHSMTPRFLPYAVIIALATALQPMSILFFSARILNELSGARTVSSIVIYVSASVALTFLLSVVKAVVTAKQELISGGNLAFARLCGIQAEKYATMDYPYTEDSKLNNTLNDIQTRANGNGVGLFQLFWSTPLIAQNGFTLVFSAILVSGMFMSSGVYARNFATSPGATAALVALIVLGLTTVFLYRRKEKPLMESALQQNAKGNSTAWHYMDYIKSDQAAKDIRLYHQAPTLMDVFDKNYGVKVWERLSFFWSRLSGYSAGVMALIGGLVYLLIGLRALAGMYPIGAVVQYVGAVTALVLCVNVLVSELGRLYNNCVYVVPLVDFLSLKDTLPKGSRPVEIKPGHNYQFEFRDVSFKYPGAQDPALKNLNMTIHPGQRLAVVGLNGSGKTTMIKLLCRLYDPDEGEILLDGVNIKEYDYDSYHRLFSVVFQDFRLFPLPVGQNIAISMQPDEARVNRCAQDAGFMERLNSLEQKLDTVLYKDFDEEGVEVSGGEAQKIALARALYKDAPVVVLDEPTAALDPISEYEVYTAFDKTIGGKTAVFISHRLSSCRFCHDIAVFEGGELLQRGSHEALLADGAGRYFELWNAQAQYYEDKDNGDMRTVI